MEIRLRVEQVAVGDEPKNILKQPRLQIEFGLDGIIGDRHAGFTKLADGRDEGIKRGTIVRNWRQWSAVSVEELKRVADHLKVDNIEPSWLGANITFSGYDQVTSIPKGSTIWFPSGLVLTVEGENAPCIGPGKVIAQKFEGIRPADFPSAAKKLRGLVGVVYRAGKLTTGDEALVKIFSG